MVLQHAPAAPVDSPPLFAPPARLDIIPSIATPADLARPFLIVLPALVLLFVPHALQATILLFVTAVNRIITPWIVVRPARLVRLSTPIATAALIAPLVRGA